MPKTFTIACDVDSVVADINIPWLARYNRDYGDSMTPADWTCWNIETLVKPECGRRIYDYLNDPTFYYDCPVVENALEGVSALREMGHRVVFVTATNLTQAGNKLRWLERHGFVTLRHGTVCRDYIECQDKSLIRAGLMVDDGPHNLEAFTGLKILFDQAHNRAEYRFPRAAGWGEVVAMVRREAR